jgi:hypothetical protein
MELPPQAPANSYINTATSATAAFESLDFRPAIATLDKRVTEVITTEVITTDVESAVADTSKPVSWWQRAITAATTVARAGVDKVSLWHEEQQNDTERMMALGSLRPERDFEDDDDQSNAPALSGMTARIARILMDRESEHVGINLPEEMLAELSILDPSDSLRTSSQTSAREASAQIATAVAANGIDSATTKSLQSFLETFLGKLFFSMLAHMALSDVKAAGEDVDVWDRISHTLYGLIAKHQAASQNLKADIKAYAHLDPEDAETAAMRPKLLESLKPICSDVLGRCGLHSIEDLQLTAVTTTLLKGYACTRFESSWSWLTSLANEKLLDFAAKQLSSKADGKSAPSKEVIAFTQQTAMAVLERETVKAQKPLELIDVKRAKLEAIDPHRSIQPLVSRAADVLADRFIADIEKKVDRNYLSPLMLQQLTLFFKAYIAKVLYKAAIHLAIASPKSAAAEQNPWPRITRTLLALITKHYDLVRSFTEVNGFGSERTFAVSLQEVLAQYDQMPADSDEEKEEKAEAYRAICAGCTPIIDDMLTTFDLNDIEDLEISPAISNLIKGAVMASQGDYAWSLMREVLTGALLEQVRTLPPLNFDLHDDAPLRGVAAATVHHGMRSLLSTLQKQTGSLGIALQELFEEQGLKGIDPEMIASVLAILLDNDDAAVHQLHDIAEQLLIPRIQSILSHTGSAPLEDNRALPAGSEAPAERPKNIIARVIATILLTAKKHLAGHDDQLRAATAAYRTHTLQLGAARSARFLLEHSSELTERIEALNEMRIDSLMAPQEHQDAIDAILKDFCDAILDHSKLTDNVADLATAIRETSPACRQLNDLDAVQYWLFGASQPLYNGQFNGNALLAQLRRRIADAKAERSSLVETHFSAMARDVLKVTGIDSDTITQIPGLQKLLSPATIGSITLMIYQELSPPLHSKKSYLEQMTDIAIGPAALSANALAQAVQAMPHDQAVQAHVLRQQQADQFANFIDNSSTAFARDIADLINNYTISLKHATLAGEKTPLSALLPDDAATLIAEALPQLSRGESGEQLMAYGEQIIQAALIKLFVKIANGQAVGGQPIDSKMIMSNLLLQIFTVLDCHRTQIARDMEKWHALPIDTDEAARQKKLLAIFLPATKDLLAIAGDMPLRDIVPPAAEESLSKALENDLLPALLSKAYLDSTALECAEASNEQRLQAIFRDPAHPERDTVAQEAMRIFAEFSVQAIPSKLALDNKPIATDAVGSMITYLQGKGAAGLQAAAYLQGHSSDAQELLAINIDAAVRNQPDTADTLKAGQKFVYSVLLEAMGNLGDSLEAAEQEDADSPDQMNLIESMATDILQLVSDHVTQLDQIRNKETKNYVFEVDPMVLLDEQADPAFNRQNNPVLQTEYLDAKRDLDSADKALINLESSLSAMIAKKAAPFSHWLGNTLDDKIKKKKTEIKDMQLKREKAQAHFDDVRKRVCYAPLSDKILKLANLDSSDKLPVPAAMREELFIKLKEQILPAVLCNICDSILDKNILNSMLLTALNALNDAAHDDAAQKAKDLQDGTADSSAVPNSAAQIANDKKLGDCVLNLATMLPTTLTKSILDIEAVRNLAAEVVGAKMRQAFSAMTMTNIIQSALRSGVENLVPGGQWVNINGKEELIQGTSNQINFHLPMDPRHKKEIDEWNAKVNAERAQKLDKTAGQTLALHIQKGLADGIKSLWQKFQKAFDNEIAKHCGGPKGWGMGIKKFLDKVCRLIFIDIIGTLVRYLAWPFLQLAKLIMEAYCNYRGKQIGQSWRAGVNDALVDDVLNIILEAILKRQEQRRQKLEADRLVAAAAAAGAVQP